MSLAMALEGMGGEPIGWSVTLSLVVMDGRKDKARAIILDALAKGEKAGLKLDEVVKLEPIYRRHKA